MPMEDTMKKFFKRLLELYVVGASRIPPSLFYGV